MSKEPTPQVDETELAKHLRKMLELKHDPNITFEVKGSNPLTEKYGILREVPLEMWMPNEPYVHVLKNAGENELPGDRPGGTYCLPLKK